MDEHLSGMTQAFCPALRQGVDWPPCPVFLMVPYTHRLFEVCLGSCLGSMYVYLVLCFFFSEGLGFPEGLSAHSTILSPGEYGDKNQTSPLTATVGC